MSKPQIIPMHSYDAMPVFANMVLTIMLKYDHVLDPIMLKNAMVELVDRDGWRKLGARLKYEKGNFIYHVPAAFSEACPAITFSHVHYDTPMAEHPAARNIPTSRPAHDRPTVVMDLEPLAPLVRRADAPATRREFIDRGLPQLELHVVTFRDGTTVGVSCLHSLLDGTALGISGLLGAWMLVLQGRGAEVPETCGFDRDPLRNLAALHKPSDPPYRHARHVSSLLGSMVWALRRAWDVWCEPAEETRMVRVPGRFVERLRQTALERLAGGGDKPAWVSEGDVLVAWWSRYATLHMPPSRPVMLTIAYNMRKALAGVLLPPADERKVFLSNCATGLMVHTTAGALAGDPAPTAAEVRRSLQDTGTAEQLAAMHAACLPDPRSQLTSRLVGSPWGDMLIYSNWTQAEFFHIDVAPAVVGGAEGKVVPSFISYRTDSRAWAMRNAHIIEGKDAQGDYWLAGTLRKGLWDRVEAALESERL
ncbi:hypothetical protein MCOR27_006859 [Pyricularia oryzae]|uniref:Uncharacterized protein n=2 Tax=Pyricularia TaxID=48558 RepID=A0ABQ8NGE4_PYRGI|nr:hypothetical protein MCOR01_006598 [Pyricularia oryzae]KAI6296682.1 hypothetical protein MCOR33_006796 [Pyricularia grisea]KAH9435953.1 hypothetical protein MCOR02_004862 [Pyricularia oryzae]KAI6263167.1 hypothetical protein MCOR19_000654 [Pyricularia oryzae]KAI6275636.1 hypothetical protein MCOR27_006859 [Pyricularia oryzae]